MTSPTHTFFGRERVLREIVQGVLGIQPASFSLVGSKLLGKSEILRFLGSEDGPLIGEAAEAEGDNAEIYSWRPLRFQDPWQIIAVNLDCNRYTSLSNAVQDGMMQTLYERIAEYVQDESNVELDWTIVEAQTTPIRRVWQLARQLNRLDYRLVVLMDNFDSVFERNLLSLDAVDELRPLTIEMAFVVATEQPLHDLDRTLAASPLFNVMTQIFIGLLEPRAAQRWVESYQQQFPRILEMSDEILVATGGHPYLVAQLGDILSEVQGMLPPSMEVCRDHLSLIRLRMAEHGRLLFVRLANRLESPPPRVKKGEVRQVVATMLDKPLAPDAISREQFSVINWMINGALVAYRAEGYSLFSPLFGEFLVGRQENAARQVESSAASPRSGGASNASANGSAQRAYPIGSDEYMKHPIAPEHAAFYKTLTKIESSLLRYFQANAQEIIPPQQLLIDIWKRPNASNRRVQEAIRRLRLQLEKAEPPVGVIENDRGRGYRFVPFEGNAPDESASDESAASDTSTNGRMDPV